MAVGRADLHVHTRLSDGFGTIEDVVDQAAGVARLDVLAVTDHEDVRGGLRAREYTARRGLPLQVVPGVEVTTLHGHLLALFVERAPRSFRGVEATLEEIHRQGGLAVVPHPASRLTRSISRRTLDRLAGTRSSGDWFDGIELANPSPAGRPGATTARERNEALWGLPATGGSDAHHLEHIGTGWTEFPGRSAEDLKRALLDGTTRAAKSSYPSLREIGFGRLALGLAWGYTATPRKLLSGRALGRA